MSASPEQPPPDWITGHEGPGGPPSRKSHLAFLALAHVGRGHADGRLLGVALAVPKEIEIADQRRCLSNFLYDDQGEPRPVRLRFGRLGTWDVRVEDREDRPMTLRPETWTATGSVPPSRCWASVTPVVLDRYPKAPGDAERTIRQGCTRVGLPEPEHVVVTPAPPFVGVPHARAFPPMLSGQQGGRRFHTHALIAFPEPVVGPVFLGAGRYRGYGLCRPWDGEGL
jgi:CRISPR-associated protein Csb2